MNETCHICMSHVSYILWNMSQMNESCHIWMSHVTYEWVISHTNESCHIWMSHFTYERVMSHMHQSCHMWMSHAISHMGDMRRRHVWHDTHMSDMTQTCLTARSFLVAGFDTLNIPRSFSCGMNDIYHLSDSVVHTYVIHKWYHTCTHEWHVSVISLMNDMSDMNDTITYVIHKWYHTCTYEWHISHMKVIWMRYRL